MGTSLTGLTPAATYQGLIKFADNSAITASAKFLSDGLGNNLPISVNPNAIGIGTTSIYNVSGYMSMFNSGNSARLGPEHFYTDSSGWYADASGSRITLSYLGYGAANGNWLVGGAANTARLSIKGSGTTSATSSILVQNSGGTQLLKVRDDNYIEFGTGSLTNYSDSTGRFYMWEARPTYITCSGTSNFNNTLTITGTGTTSATTTLLVRNSSSNQILKTTDDGKVIMGTGTTGTALLDVAVGAGSTPPLRLKGYSDAGTAYLLSAGTESFQDNFKIKMVNGNVTMGTQQNGYNFGLETFNGTAMTIYNAGNIGIATTSIAASSLLQMDSTSKGFLPPRMTDAQVRAIATPSAGLMAYNTDLDCPVFYSTAGWRKISHSAM